MYFPLSVVFFAFIANSQQLPTGIVTQSDPSNDDKLNTSNAVWFSSDRSASYPSANGWGYYNMGQTMMNVPHYPSGFPINQFPNTLPVQSNTQLRSAEIDGSSNGRTLGLGHHVRPTFYSQYQTVPQVYSTAYVQPAEYSIPYLSGHSYGYTPYLRDAEEEKPRQFIVSSDKYFSAQPSVQYTSKYLLEKPSYASMQYTALPQVDSSLPLYAHDSIPQTNELPVTHVGGRDAAEGQMMGYNSIPLTQGLVDQPFMNGRNIFVNDQLEMQIPQNYLMNKLQQLPSAPLPTPVQRAANEPNPMAWTQQFSNPTIKRDNQQMQFPYITPEDKVYMVPNSVPEQFPGSRAVEPQGFVPMFPNQFQGYTLAQMQGIHDSLRKGASEMENLIKRLQNDQSSRSNSALLDAVQSQDKSSENSNKPAANNKQTSNVDSNLKDSTAIKTSGN